MVRCTGCGRWTDVPPELCEACLVDEYRVKAESLRTRLAEVEAERDEMRVEWQEARDLIGTAGICHGNHASGSLVYAVRQVLRRLQEAEAERDAYRRDFEAELDGAARLRERLGARADEGFPGFVERLAAERDALVERLDCARAGIDVWCQRADELQAELDRLRAVVEASRRLRTRRPEEALGVSTSSCVDCGHISGHAPSCSVPRYEAALAALDAQEET